MEREAILAWMERQAPKVTNRALAEMLGISEDKVSKSLTDKGKPRQWKAAEALKLSQIINSDTRTLVRTDVRGTGLSAAEVREAWAGRPDLTRSPATC